MKKIKAAVPLRFKMKYRAARSLVRLVRYSSYDFRRFASQSASTVSMRALAQEDADITRTYHAIEKGLSIRSPRPGFGQDVIRQLCVTLSRRLEEREPWTQSCQDAVDALAGYVAFNQRVGGTIIPEIHKTLELAAAGRKTVVGTPTKPMMREEILAAVNFDTNAFFGTRHSVRQFEAGDIDKNRLNKALAHALTTPSVCNRQSGRVRIAVRGECDLDFLRLQNGNRGFGHEAQAIAIVTSDLSAFLDATERQQAMVDGGMFAMMVVLGLHAEGFGACCLNWSQTDGADRALRKAISLPSSETVITLIAIGNLPAEFPVARSHRLAFEDVVTFIRL